MRQILTSGVGRRAVASAGFTLAELLIVVAITALLASVLIVYSRKGEGPVILIRERSTLIDVLHEAKARTIETRRGGAGIFACGYGVHFDFLNASYTLFGDAPAGGATECLAGANYTGNRSFDFGEEVKTVKIDQSVALISNDPSFSHILFIPPDPKTYLLPSLSNAITLSLQSSAGLLKTTITDVGQITTD